MEERAEGGRALRWAGRVALGVVVLLVGLVGVVWVLLQRVDWSGYLEPLVARAEVSTGRAIEVGGPVRLSPSLTPTLQVGALRIGNAEWGTRPEMLAVDRFELRLALWPLLVSRRIEIGTLVRSGVEVWLETDADGQGNWVLTGAGEPAPEAGAPPSETPSSPPAGDVPTQRAPGPQDSDGVPEAAGSGLPWVEALRIEDARLGYRDGRTGEVEEGRIERLDLAMASPEAPLEVTAEIEARGEALSLAASVRGLADAGAGPVDLALRLSGEDLAASLEGEVAAPTEASGLDLRFALAGQRLDSLSALAKSELPALGPYRLAGRLSDPPEGWRIEDLELEMAQSRLAGSLDVALSGPRPSLRARLRSPLLRVEDFQAETAASGAPPPVSAGAESPTGSAAAGAGSAPPAGSGSERLLTDEPLPLDALDSADLDLELAAETLVVGGPPLSDVTLAAVLRDRVLAVRELSAGLAGGRLEAGANLDAPRASRAVLTLDLRGSELDAGALLSDLGLGDMVSGSRLALDADLAADGSSPRALAASLDGEIGLRLGPGELSERSARWLLRDVGSLLSGDAGTESTSLNCMLGRIVSRAGIGELESFALDTPLLAVLGSGRIDFGRERLALRLDPVVKQANLSRVTPPSRVGGSFAAPEVGVDKGGVAAKALDVGLRLARGKSVVGSKDVKTSPGLAGCEELQAQRTKLLGTGASRAEAGSGSAGEGGKQAPEALDPEKELRRTQRRLLEGLLGE